MQRPTQVEAVIDLTEEGLTFYEKEQERQAKERIDARRDTQRLAESWERLRTARGKGEELMRLAREREGNRRDIQQPGVETSAMARLQAVLDQTEEDMRFVEEKIGDPPDLELLAVGPERGTLLRLLFAQVEFDACLREMERAQEAEEMRAQEERRRAIQIERDRLRALREAEVVRLRALRERELELAQERDQVRGVLGVARNAQVEMERMHEGEESGVEMLRRRIIQRQAR